ncbi:Transcriptional regulator, IclR family [Paraburkholderia sacchari]
MLKLLTRAGRRGLALSDLAVGSRIPHSSVHRVLRQLIDEDLAHHDAETRRYRLGPLAFELGLASSALYDIRGVCKGEMESLAKATGDIVYLVSRSGFEAVCVHSCEGNFPARPKPLDVGSRRPLGVGAGGLAILSALCDDERNRIIEQISSVLPAFGTLDAKALELACQQSIATKRAVVRHRVTFGVAAVGMPFRDVSGRPVGALTVASFSQRMTQQRVDNIADDLLIAVKALEAKLPLSASMMTAAAAANASKSASFT